MITIKFRTLVLVTQIELLAENSELILESTSTSIYIYIYLEETQRVYIQQIFNIFISQSNINGSI